MLAVTILSLITTTKKIADSLRYVFLFLPNYCFGQALSDMYQNAKYTNALQKVLDGQSPPGIHKGNWTDVVQRCEDEGLPKCCTQVNELFIKYEKTSSYICPVSFLSLDVPGIGRYALALLVQIFIFWAALMFIERRASGGILSSLFSSAPPAARQELDEDVQAEHARIDSLTAEQIVELSKGGDLVAIQNLRKTFLGGSKGRSGQPQRWHQTKRVFWPSRCEWSGENYHVPHAHWRSGSKLGNGFPGWIQRGN